MLYRYDPPKEDSSEDATTDATYSYSYRRRPSGSSESKHFTIGIPNMVFITEQKDGQHIRVVIGAKSDTRLLVEPKASTQTATVDLD